MTQKLVQSTIHSVLPLETKEIAAANSLIQTVSAASLVHNSAKEKKREDCFPKTIRVGKTVSSIVLREFPELLQA